ncbi:uncharacterized protein LOC134197252 [Corticium candelabrum]|uniref:uncharacterized protein LOC134197252 n=1 Tax=Corticium candelabrum TaxID=121492 RepID=UPI002E262921|nr:uncharacterized protein LOC134197252 [Corticium candelabrum]
MAFVFSLIYLFVALCCCHPSFVTTNDVKCKRQTSCSCEMSDDSGSIDLHPLVSGQSQDQPAFQLLSNGYLYTYNPCTPVDYENEVSTCTANDDPAVCQIFSNGTGKGVRCGSQADVSFTAYKHEMTGVQEVNITYRGGQGTRFSTVTLKCDNNQHATSQFEFEGENPPGHYNFLLTSYYSCPRRSGKKLAISGGSIFLILLFVLLISYFVLGVLFQKYRRDASGKELIPNYQFWSSLPGLVKDGFLFLLNKCRKREASYENLQ